MNCKKLLLLLSVLGLIGCKETTAPSEGAAAVRTEMDSLFERHQYFGLRTVFQEKQQLLEEKDRLLIAAKLKAVFNDREASNELIGELLNGHRKSLTDDDRVEVLKTQINNSVLLFDYVGAAGQVRKLLNLDNLSEEDQKDFSNTLILLESLKNAPAQSVSLREDELPITKDFAGLDRIPINLNTIKQEVVFDTGANFSVITDSLAVQVGIEIIGKPFKVKAITGGEVDSRIGVADSLQLGKTLLRNAVFLVFPEASLSFPQVNYTIDAILGFPVINALEEVMLVNGERFVITGGKFPTPTPNLALDFLTPVIEVLEEGKSLPFTFDTGANATALYVNYFKLRKQEITGSGRKDSLHYGGAGGSVKVPVYIHSFSGRIGNSQFTLDSVAIHTENVREMPGIYGNLGQDVLRQFDTLVIDFEEMGFMLK